MFRAFLMAVWLFFFGDLHRERRRRCPKCLSIRRGQVLPVNYVASYCENGLCDDCCHNAGRGCCCLAALQAKTRETRKTAAELVASQPLFLQKPGSITNGKA